MGQYWNAFVEDENKTVRIIDRGTFKDYVMAKLMEHSWMLNDYICAVAHIIYKHPTKLLWLGDYGSELLVEKLPDTQLAELIRQDEGMYLPSYNVKGLYERLGNPDDIIFDYKGKYFCNHDLKTAISFDDYIKRCQDHTAENDKDWIPSPISLLTAIGSGLGGGDYGESCANYDHVGDWAYSLVSIEDELPDGYTLDNDLYFTENDINPPKEGD